MSRFRNIFSYRKYINHLKEYPGTHLTSFLILHEITAIVPLPFVYYYLDQRNVEYPVPQEFIAAGNKRMGRMLELVGIPKPEPDSKAMMHLVASYFIVKSLMPLRMAISIGLTPYFATILSKILPKRFTVKK